MRGAGGNEPNPRFWVGPVFIVAEQGPIGVCEHEDGASADGGRDQAGQRQDQRKFHREYLSQATMMLFHKGLSFAANVRDEARRARRARHVTDAESAVASSMLG